MARGETYPAGQITVKGMTVEVKTNDAGEWLAWPGGHSNEIRSGTKEGLKAAIARHIRVSRTAVAVPFVSVNGTTVRASQGTAYGLHATHHNVLVTWADGVKEQLNKWGGNKILDGDTDPEQWRQLAEASNAAARALHAYEEAHKLDLGEAVREAIDKAMAGPENQTGD